MSKEELFFLVVFNKKKSRRILVNLLNSPPPFLLFGLLFSFKFLWFDVFVFKDAVEHFGALCAA